jgi:hypothetical protein
VNTPDTSPTMPPASWDGPPPTLGCSRHSTPTNDIRIAATIFLSAPAALPAIAAPAPMINAIHTGDM